MNLTDFKVLSFDCYGTLIDWETGILQALQPLVARCEVQPTNILEAFASAESVQEAATPAMLYPNVLTAVHQRLAEQWGVAAPDDLHARFGASVPDWPAFPDSRAALRYLKQHFKLVILSNVDRVSFAGSNAWLGVPFDAIYTAQDIGSYKPALRNFDYLIDHVQRDLGVAPDAILHTAQSLFHDHEPARQKGLATAWIDRRHDQDGWGATMPPGEMPSVDFHFPSMAALAEAHRK